MLLQVREVVGENEYVMGSKIERRRRREDAKNWKGELGGRSILHERKQAFFPFVKLKFRLAFMGGCL